MRILITTIVTCLGLAGLYACTATGRVGVGYEGGGRKGHVLDVNWNFAGPVGECGCMYWYDRAGEQMDSPAGQITNGSGGGVVPKGAAGWRIELVDCEDFEGCDDDGLVGGPPGLGVATPGSAPGRRVRYFGAVMSDLDPDSFGDERALVFDLLITADTDTLRDQAFQSVIDNLESKPIPNGVEIIELTVGSPVFDGAASADSFLGFEVTAYDDQPLEAFAVRWNGQAAFANGPGNFAGNGFFTNAGFVPEDLVHQNWNGTNNLTEMLRDPEGEAPLVSEVFTWWVPDPR